MRSILTWVRTPAFARVIPFMLFVSLVAMTPALRDQRAFDPRLVYPLKVIVVTALLAALWRQYGELKEIRAVSKMEWLYSGLTGALVFGLWINLGAAWMRLGESAGFDPRGADGATDWWLAGFRLAGAAMLVPIVEELFWRSFFMRWIGHSSFLCLSPNRIGWRALWASSLAFALEHNLWFAGLIAGLSYGALYRRSGNLWVPIVSHAITNLLLGIFVLVTGQWHFW
jgi:uncharacterized protein